MRFEPKLVQDDGDVDLVDLPDDLAALAAQLSEDAAHLERCYPAEPTPVALPSAAGTFAAGVSWTRVAAAVVVMGVAVGAALAWSRSNGTWASGDHAAIRRPASPPVLASDAPATPPRDVAAAERAADDKLAVDHPAGDGGADVRTFDVPGDADVWRRPGRPPVADLGLFTASEPALGVGAAFAPGAGPGALVTPVARHVERMTGAELEGYLDLLEYEGVPQGKASF